MRNDLTGKRFGKWTVLGLGDMAGRSATQQSVWRCRCDCGVEKDSVLYGALTKGSSRSCGCLRKDKTTGKIGAFTEHKVEYTAWLSMKTRCYNSNHPTFKNYGGKGIAMCREWHDSFECFFRDMGARPVGDYSLERIDGSLGYSKDNCVWASRLQQGRNKERVKLLEWNGMIMTLTEICRKEGVDYCSAYQSLYKMNRSIVDTVNLLKARGLVFKERAKGMKPHDFPTFTQ